MPGTGEKTEKTAFSGLALARNLPKFSATPVKNRGNAGPVPVIRR